MIYLNARSETNMFNKVPDHARENQIQFQVVEYKRWFLFMRPTMGEIEFFGRMSNLSA